MNRYPELFRRVRELVDDGPDPRILSFGCSTGEEVISLRRYFHDATIVGIDINPVNIATCHYRWRKVKDDKIHFVVSGSAAGEADSSYDVIFALAVFRHGDLNTLPPPPKCDHRICFADFERSVTELTRSLKPGGLLVIQYAMFRFGDTRTAAEFERALSIDDAGNFPLYGADNCVLADADYTDVVFRKVALRSSPTHLVRR